MLNMPHDLLPANQQHSCVFITDYNSISGLEDTTYASQVLAEPINMLSALGNKRHTEA